MTNTSSRSDAQAVGANLPLMVIVTADRTRRDTLNIFRNAEPFSTRSNVRYIKFCFENIMERLHLWRTVVEHANKFDLLTLNYVLRNKPLFWRKVTAVTESIWCEWTLKVTLILRTTFTIITNWMFYTYQNRVKNFEAILCVINVYELFLRLELQTLVISYSAL